MDKNVSDASLIMDFAVHVGREMLESGANLERLSITIQRICKTYRMREISVYVVNSIISVAAKDEYGENHMRQESVPSIGIHLERLKKLNKLVHRVMREKPKPAQLEDMLFDTLLIKQYSTIATLGGYILAMICLCRIFGGVWQDMVVVAVNTVILYFITMLFSREKVNRIISNVVSMFSCAMIGIMCSKMGFAKHFSAIIITNAFYLIPGIPMVNAFRNILCGNEMNGIIEMVKVLLEVVTIVAGLYIACLCFGFTELAF